MRSAVLLLLAAASAGSTLPMPGGEGGIGFDDLMWSPALDRVLVPSGRTGKLNLVDPKTLAVESISGFSNGADFKGGHGKGTTSADAGRGLIFASDRDAQSVRVFDAKTHAALSTVNLAGGPDYVRWVERLGELWVTEPRKKQIETFVLEGKTLEHRGAISVPEGPESLTIDAARGRAYAHSWHDHTYAIDLEEHRVAATWTNGCKGSRGIALDAEHGWLFVGCDEGAAVALDVKTGARVGQVKTGEGVDIIAYAPKLQHLYVPGGDSATMSIVAVAPNGALSNVRSVPTAKDATCVATSGDGRVFVCDPAHGRLLVIEDR
jgi:outer membrane protein assembly factor BamB